MYNNNNNSNKYHQQQQRRRHKKQQQQQSRQSAIQQLLQTLEFNFLFPSNNSPQALTRTHTYLHIQTHTHTHFKQSTRSTTVCRMFAQLLHHICMYIRIQMHFSSVHFFGQTIRNYIHIPFNNFRIVSQNRIKSYCKRSCVYTLAWNMNEV